MNNLEYENYQEKTLHGDPLFPYITYPCTIPLDFAQVPLHWHDEAEFIYVKKGRGTVTVDFVCQTASAGTLALILPGQLHAIGPYETESMEYENIIFHPDILFSGKADTGSSLLVSLFSGRMSVPSFYTPDDPCYTELIACVDANDEISRTHPFGYQLYIKSQLHMFFYLLANRCRPCAPPEKNHASLEKMKLILKYIETRYAEKNTIPEIARACGISPSHFMRCFKDTMGRTFTAYLNEYRLAVAARLLVSSDAQILTVAAECGYDNLSYFNRVFKAHFHMTPREYRRLHASGT